ncbi:MAG: cation:proton antiporter [Acidimicrobiales bacterium]
MDIAEILRHILIVLVAAKVAAELADRVGVPAVVGEIVAGIVIGPSVLNAVGGGDEVLRTLGELGVILLLLDVGLEMDLGELGKVGRTSFVVALIGVAAPLLLGTGAMSLLGADGNTALFVGAALTATSVGITARVFGDLRALATTEARIVLGAAVADDVMGLVVLTVVVRIATGGSVSVASVGGIIAVAVAFLVVGGIVGLRVAPRLFATIDRLARSTGTLVALALAFTLAFAELADLARLAPIVGAFVAGIAMSRSRQADRIRGELAPVGHLFIPVFFLQIGIDADLGAFARPEVVRMAGALLVVACIGKLLSPLGAIGSPGDKAMIGLGMLPRGEVGLIFAAIGLQTGVLSDDHYAALLAVVLLTTLGAPALLKLRFERLRALERPAAPAGQRTPPPGGWLRVGRDDVDLTTRPADHLAVPIGLEAAVFLARRRPGPGLLDWFGEVRPTEVRWDPALVSRLLDVIERGNSRSWRFLETTGILDAGLPEIAAVLRRRAGAVEHVDLSSAYRVQVMDRLRVLDPDDPVALDVRGLARVDRFLLAAFLAEFLGEQSDAASAAGPVVERLGLDPEDRTEVLAMVRDRDLLWSAMHQSGALSEDRVWQLAAHLDTPERARALYAMSALRHHDRDRWELQRLRELHDLVQATLADEDLSLGETRRLAERRRAEAAELLPRSSGPAERLSTAPATYVLRTPPAALARHAQLLDGSPVQRPQVAIGPAEDDGRSIDVAWSDRPGRLAAITKALADAGHSIESAVLATWADGTVLDAFRVRAGGPPVVAEQLERAIEHAAASTMTSPSLPDAEVVIDAAASPWHTVCEIRCTDRPGLLHALATAFAVAGIEVRSAEVHSHDGLVLDRFEVTGHTGAKLTAGEVDRLRAAVQEGVTARRRRLGGRLTIRASTT